VDCKQNSQNENSCLLRIKATSAMISKQKQEAEDIKSNISGRQH